ncbi:MAG: hypothetical protein DWH82_08095 [Planctomycetota bacterium]|nr:MAG: hypothetical protein DWH82_08095 [Planctomycetota bacterium]
MSLLALMLVCQQADGNRPQAVVAGDFSLLVWVDKATVQIGETILITARVKATGVAQGNRLTGSAARRPVFPTPFFVTPPDALLWQVDRPAEQMDEDQGSLTRWWLVALRPGLWRLPDIACHYQRDDLPFPSARAMFRLQAVEPVRVAGAPPTGNGDWLGEAIRERQTRALAFGWQAWAALNRLLWIGPGVACLVLAIWGGPRWPSGGEAQRAHWRAWLTAGGLPPGRHTSEGVGHFLAGRGWSIRRVAELGALWENPMDVPTLPNPVARTRLVWLVAGSLGLAGGLLLIHWRLPLTPPGLTDPAIAAGDAAWTQGQPGLAITQYQSAATSDPLTAALRLGWASRSLAHPDELPNLVKPTAWLLMGLAWGALHTAGWLGCGLRRTWPGAMAMALVPWAAMALWPGPAPSGQGFTLVASQARSGDGPDFPNLAELPAGQRVQILRNRPGWVAVNLPGVGEGWLPEQEVAGWGRE